jgi:hypothetical protein
VTCATTVAFAVANNADGSELLKRESTTATATVVVVVVIVVVIGGGNEHESRLSPLSPSFDVKTTAATLLAAVREC